MATVIEVLNFQEALHKHIKVKKLTQDAWVFADSRWKIKGLRNYKGIVFITPSKHIKQELLTQGLIEKEGL